VRYWLMKTEPDVFSIDDLARDGVTPWEGVRSYQARNLLRDQVHVGDAVLFYHSSTEPPGVAGLAEVVRESYPDRTQFDPASPYFDPKSTQDNPRWFVVDVRFVERFPAVVPLAVLHTTPGLEDMVVLKRGMRLSVQPVTEDEWRIVVALGRATREAPPAEAPAVRSKATGKAAGKAPKRKTRSSATKAKAGKRKAPTGKAAGKAPARKATSKAPARKATGKTPARKATPRQPAARA
jgi:predicted RNA-binding protein with PUA-like domain